MCETSDRLDGFILEQVCQIIMGAPDDVWGRGVPEIGGYHIHAQAIGVFGHDRESNTILLAKLVCQRMHHC